MSVPFCSIMEKLGNFKLVVDDRGTEDDKKMMNRILFAMRSKHYRTAYTLFVVYFDRGMRGVMNDFHFPADRPTFELLFETLIHGQHLRQYFSSVVDCGTEEDKEITSRILLAMRRKDYRTACD